MGGAGSEADSAGCACPARELLVSAVHSQARGDGFIMPQDLRWLYFQPFLLVCKISLLLNTVRINVAIFLIPIMTNESNKTPTPLFL